MTGAQTMLRTIVCGVCSKEKNSESGLIPARARYLGSHIELVSSLAYRQSCEAYVLSGKYGLITLETPIADYDLLLTYAGVPELASRVTEQLIVQGIGHVHFYTKDGLGWLPYVQTMQVASAYANVRLALHYLAKDE